MAIPVYIPTNSVGSFPFLQTISSMYYLWEWEWSESEIAQSCPTLCDPMDSWSVAHRASPSMEFSRQEYWSGLPFPSPGDLPDPGIKPGSPSLRADALPSEPPGVLNFLFIYFSWRITTLQYCGVFCHASIWISHRYTCVPFILNPLPTSFHTLSLQDVTEHWLWVPCVIHQPCPFYLFCIW